MHNQKLQFCPFHILPVVQGEFYKEAERGSHFFQEKRNFIYLILFGKSTKLTVIISSPSSLYRETDCHWFEIHSSFFLRRAVNENLVITVS